VLRRCNAIALYRFDVAVVCHFVVMASYRFTVTMSLYHDGVPLRHYATAMARRYDVGGQANLVGLTSCHCGVAMFYRCTVVPF